MGISHLLAMIPLLILLVLSLVFYGKALVHLMTLTYALCLAVLAVLGQWEILFWPITVGSAIISVLLLTFAWARGNWL